MFKTGDSPIPGYQLLRFIGQGAYGEVWETQAPGGTRVALKFIPLQSSVGGVELKAANAVKLIRHANLIPITAIWLLDREGSVLDDQALERLDADVLTERTISAKDLEFKRSLAYLVVAMSLADESLEECLERYQKEGHVGIPTERLVEYIREAAKGLDFLNEPRHTVNGDQVGIVHRDVKPANLLLLGDSVVVGDFGVATSLRAFDEQATSLVGSLGFMSPESIDRRPTNTTDQYALAITYYYLRTGQTPYGDGHTFDSLAQVHKEGKLDFTLVTPGERAVIQKATAISPELRYKTCSEFVAAISAATQQAIDEPVKQNKLLIPISILAGLLGLAGIGFFIFSGVEKTVGGNETIAKHPYSLTVSPEDAKITLKVMSNDDVTKSVSGVGKVNLELAKDDKVEVRVVSDSPFFIQTNATLSRDELEQQGWHITLEKLSVGDVRQQVLQLLESGEEDRASRLLSSAAKLDQTILEFPPPVQTPLQYQLELVSVGLQPSNFALLARDEEQQKHLFFGNVDDSMNATGSWVESQFASHLLMTQLEEFGPWLVVTEDSIGTVSESGQYDSQWQPADGADVEFTCAAFSVDKRTLIAGDFSGDVHTWKIEMDGTVGNYQTKNVHSELVKDVSFTKSGDSYVSAGEDGTYQRFETDSNRVETPLKKLPNGSFIEGVKPLGDRSLVFRTEGNVFELAANGDLSSVLGKEFKQGIQSVFCSTSSNWIAVETAGLTNPVLLINSETKESFPLPVERKLREIRDVGFANDGTLMAISTTQGHFELVDVSGDKPIWNSLAPSKNDYRKHVFFTKDGKSLIAIIVGREPEERFT